MIASHASATSTSAPAKPRSTKPALSIIDAFDSPRLFQKWFDGDSWNNWRTILKAAYALPMTDDELEFFTPLPAIVRRLIGKCANFGSLEDGERARTASHPQSRHIRRRCSPGKSTCDRASALRSLVWPSTEIKAGSF
jgi:hypothetical protein